MSAAGLSPQATASVAGRGTSPASSGAARRLTHLLDAPIDHLTQESFLARVEAFIAEGGSRLVCYANAECINQSLEDRAYARILQAADLVCADGMGVVWASRLTGDPLPERVNVGDVMERFCALAAAKGYRLFLLGGSPGVAKRAAARLKRRFPGLEIAGTHHGYFSHAQDADVVRTINQTRPHVLLVGMGVPRQEKWLWQHRAQLRAPVLWGVGALFSYYAGLMPRAPVWLRAAGLEWLFRLLLEPQRLWKRYLVGNAFFIVRTLALPLIDAGLVSAAWLGAYWMWRWLDDPFGFTINDVEPYVQAVALIVGIWLVTCAGFGLYRRPRRIPVLEEFSQVVRATAIGWLSTMAAGFLFRELSVGRPVVLLAGILIFVLLLASRLTVRALEWRLAQRGLGLRRALIVGTGALADRLKGEIEGWPAGHQVMGFVSDGKGEHAVPASDVVGSVTELERLIRDWRIQDVFLASQNLRLDDELNLLQRHERLGLNFHVVSKELEPFAKRLPLGRAVELPLLNLPSTKPNGGYEWSKHAFDVAVAACGVALGWPLLLLIALWIRLDSPGPALFTQQRVGLRGRRFAMYKFRTMTAGTPVYAVAPNDTQDPRVTRAGRVLRRWSLDELPQLINIVRGDMSLVGPRPEMPFLVERYKPWQRQRLCATPGLTCLWQVLGRKELPLHHNMEYDLYYVRHRGWPLDLAILSRTIPAVFFRRGAF